MYQSVATRLHHSVRPLRFYYIRSDYEIVLGWVRATKRSSSCLIADSWLINLSFTPHSIHIWSRKSLFVASTNFCDGFDERKNHCFISRPRLRGNRRSPLLSLIVRWLQMKMKKDVDRKTTFNRLRYDQMLPRKTAVSSLRRRQP